MAQTSTDSMIAKIVKEISQIEGLFQRLRYEYPFRELTVASHEEFCSVGGKFYRHIFALGHTGGKLNPKKLDLEFMTRKFEHQMWLIYGELNGFVQASDMATSGTDGGMQKIFQDVTDAMQEEHVANAITNLFYDGEFSKLITFIDQVEEDLQLRKGALRLNLDAVRKLLTARAQERRGNDLLLGKT